MGRIRVSTTIDATPGVVWTSLEDLGSHVLWMRDARAIRFRTSQRKGRGTVFECDTRVGPFSLTDVMEITSWRPRRRMGVRHAGLVTGTGAFVLRARRGGRTRFTWGERLRFPWWLGGPMGELVGGGVLRWIWRANLRTLKHLVESSSDHRS